MAVFKCKMCGGTLDITAGTTVVRCDYCDTTQTVPSADDEKKIALFTRANRLRAGNEFDKASGIYESIIADFPEEAEAYWGLVLCKYGVEYVDDPATGNKIPTCHRSSFESVMDDNNFELTLEYADAFAKRVYREEAKQLEEIRKGIIAVSSKEEPYDIFICYKETDEHGNRTIDSVLAQDIYDILTAKGYRTFFARITLEDKLGQEYEPYIFAALNTAKIMLAVGTSFEHYDAVWVKNEWSRFLKLMAADKSKHLIPCFKNLDAYDMPKEFARLQAQDLGKVGADQDLLRGIEKILPKQKAETVKEVVGTGGNSTTAPLLKRAFMFLEDEEWAKADEKFENVLDTDPENADAYLGKLMVELRASKREQLAQVRGSFENNKNYIKIMRFGSTELKKELEDYLATAKEASSGNAFAEPIGFENCSVLVTSCGPMKLSVIKIVRTVTGYGLKEAKDFVESLPAYLVKDVPYEQALNIKNDLEAAGATCEIKQSSNGKIETKPNISFSTNLSSDNYSEKAKPDPSPSQSAPSKPSEIIKKKLTERYQTSITIPDGVTAISDCAYKDYKNLVSITIPDSVTSIGAEAFSGCTALTSITIPDSVTTIGVDAFYNCKALTNVVISANVTSIGDAAFNGCRSLANITIPDSVTSIGESAFFDCTSLTCITIPDNVTHVGDFAFRGCTNLDTVTIGNGVTEIGWHAFADCTGLDSITIGNSVTEFGEEAFYNCTALTTITIPDSVTKIGNGAFKGCNGLTNITIPNSVTEIGYSAFEDCNLLASVIIPNSVRTIGEYAFSGCNSLTSVTIGNSVTTIGNSAFEECYDLASITIPDSVTTIGESAFKFCKSLTSVEIPNSGITIGSGAFSFCDTLTSVTVPKSVKLVASDVFFLSPVFDNRRKQGVCLYCGGKFKGLFTKTCEKCGRNKDY